MEQQNSLGNAGQSPTGQDRSDPGQEGDLSVGASRQDGSGKQESGQEQNDKASGQQGDADEKTRPGSQPYGNELDQEDGDGDGDEDDDDDLGDDDNEENDMPPVRAGQDEGRGGEPF